MSDASEAVRFLREAARLNREDPLLEGSVLHLPDYGQLVMTGDLHGHRRNFEKLRKFCELDRWPMRHVILHELIHEEPVSFNDPDRSHELLLAAARWKCAFPEQVHFLQSNHELSQLTGHEITKGGRIVTRDFEAGVVQAYNAGAADVLEAIGELIGSYALAGRTRNRVFLSHSLPGPRHMDEFDVSALDRPTTMDDLHGRGTAYAMVWGRYQTPELLRTLGEALDVDFFICGHQPQEEGFEVVHDRMIILASDHNHGVFLPMDLRRRLTLFDLTRLIRPFAAIA